MQLRITTVTGTISPFVRGDILAVHPDNVVWGTHDTMAAWVASGRNASEFPCPWFAVVQMDGEPPDKNLAEPWIEPDLRGDGGKTKNYLERMWRVEIDHPEFPAAVLAALELPGGIAKLPRRQRRFVTRKIDSRPMPLWSSAEPGNDDGNIGGLRRAGTDERARKNAPRVR